MATGPLNRKRRTKKVLSEDRLFTICCLDDCCNDQLNVFKVVSVLDHYHTVHNVPIGSEISFGCPRCRIPIQTFVVGRSYSALCTLVTAWCHVSNIYGDCVAASGIPGSVRTVYFHIQITSGNTAC